MRSVMSRIMSVSVDCSDRKVCITNVDERFLPHYIRSVK